MHSLSVDQVEQRVIDDTLCIVGLLLLQDLLFMSNYPDDLKEAVRKRTAEVIANIQARQVYDKSNG